MHSSLSWILIFAIPASAGLILLAPRVIDLLYGSDYAPAAPALAILALDIPLLFLISFFGNVTAAVGWSDRLPASISVQQASMLLSTWRSYRQFGILAAASVTIATDVISAAVFLILLERRMGLPRSGYRLPQIAAGTAVMMAAVLLLRSMPLPVVIGISGFVYLIVANQLKLLNLLSLFEGRPSRTATRDNSRILDRRSRLWWCRHNQDRRLLDEESSSSVMAIRAAAAGAELQIKRKADWWRAHGNTVRVITADPYLFRD